MFSFLASAADCSRLRLAAACGIIKIAQEAHCIEYITLEIFQQLSLVMQVIDYELSICSSLMMHLVPLRPPPPPLPRQILHKQREIINVGYAISFFRGGGGSKQGVLREMCK